MLKEALLPIKRIESDELSTLPAFLAAREDAVAVQNLLAEPYRLPIHKIATTVLGTDEAYSRLGRINTLKHGVHPAEVDSIEAQAIYPDTAGIYFRHLKSVVVRKNPLFEVEIDDKKYGINAHREHYKHILYHENGHGVLDEQSTRKSIDRKTATQLVATTEQVLETHLLKSMLSNPFLLTEYVAQTFRNKDENVVAILEKLLNVEEKTLFPFLREMLVSNPAWVFYVLNLPPQKFEAFCKMHVQHCHFESLGRHVVCYVQVGEKNIRLGDLQHPSREIIEESFAETYSLYCLYKEFEAQQKVRPTSFAASIASFKESLLFKRILQAPSTIILPLLDVVVEVGSFEKTLDLIKECTTLNAEPKKLSEGTIQALTKVARAHTLNMVLMSVMSQYDEQLEFQSIANIRIFDQLQPNVLEQMVADNPDGLVDAVRSRIIQHRLDNPSQFFADVLSVYLDISEYGTQRVTPTEATKTELMTEPVLVIDIFKDGAKELGKERTSSGIKELIGLFENMAGAAKV